MVNPIFANPTTAARRLTIGGSDWLWVVTVIMGFSALFVLAWSKYVGLTPVSLCTHLTGGATGQQRAGARAFHYMAVAILTVSTIAYFAMASNLGQTPVRTEFRRGPTRSIFVRPSPFDHARFLSDQLANHSTCDIFSGLSTHRSFCS
jgi:bacteriorhodopsin